MGVDRCDTFQEIVKVYCRLLPLMVCHEQVWVYCMGLGSIQNAFSLKTMTWINKPSRDNNCQFCLILYFQY